MKSTRPITQNTMKHHHSSEKQTVSHPSLILPVSRFSSECKASTSHAEVRAIVPPSHCAPVPLSPSHCANVPLCPWTVKKLLRFGAKVSDFGIFGSVFKTAASFFGFFFFLVLFCFGLGFFVCVCVFFYRHLKQCSIANFFV